MSAIPVYTDGEEAYEADTCRPLAEATQRGEIRLKALVHGHYPGTQLPRLALPEIKSVGYWDAPRMQNWGLPWHRNEGIELTFLESGSASFAVENRHFRLQPDDLTITRPWQRHRVGEPLVSASKLHWLILDIGVRRPNQAWTWPPWFVLSRADIERLTDLIRHNEEPIWRASPDVRRCFQGIAQAVEARDATDNVSRLAVYVNELFLCLLDLIRSHNPDLDRSLSSSRRTVELFLAELRAQMENRPHQWSVEEMARSCGLGVTQFTNHVRKITNMTPSQHLTQCRLDRAARLLREDPKRSITDIALDCGFSSAQYFATSFRQRFGCSPRYLRADETRPSRVGSQNSIAV